MEPHGQVLIANRSETRRTTLANLLQGLGYVVDEADSSDQVLHLAKTKHFDCVLTEYGLPGGDARRLVVELKSGDPDTQVIVFDALPDTPTYIRFMEDGAFDYLGPNEPADRLLDRTRHAVALSKAGPQAQA